MDTASPATLFADVARRLGAACHELSMPVPAFRSPPRKPDCTRTLRRYQGGAVVSVRLRERTQAEWTRDMIDGCIAAAKLTGHDAEVALERLTEAVA